MPLLSRNGRKLLIALSLLSAISLLICGQTILKSSLLGKSYIIYWCVCMFFTTLSLYLALVELRTINMESRKEFKDLLDKTLDEIRSNYNEIQKRDDGKNKNQGV